MDLQTSLKTTLKTKYQKLNEAASKKSSRPLKLEFHDIQYDKASSKCIIKIVLLTDVLSCECQHDGSKKTIVTSGVSGVGKTTTVQHCALEWAEGRGFPDIHLLFPLTFWELSLLKQELSLIELLRTFYPELKQLDASSLNERNVWFVLDGLDEYHRRLNFSCPVVGDVSKASSVDILVTNLIRGNLLPRAHVWILTQDSASVQIPQVYWLKETKLVGFALKEQDEHFKTVIGNDTLAQRAIDHVRIFSMGMLSKIPSICTLLASVLKDHVKPRDGIFKITPLSLTQIYTNLVKASNPNVVAKLKKLALFRMSEGKESHVMFEGDLLKSDISAEEASAFSKECPLLLREETGLRNTTVFRFGHSSVQEFLAALAKVDDAEAKSISVFCHGLVDKMLQSKEGESGLLLRFFFGLIKEHRLLERTDSLFAYTKKMILKYDIIELIYSLREYDSQALQEEVKYFENYGHSPIPGITPDQWEKTIFRIGVVAGLKSSFDMPWPLRTEERLLSQLPCILKSRKANLRFFKLTNKSCTALATVLSAEESVLRELDLGYNSFSDYGIRDLAQGLMDSNCRLKVLRLPACGLNAEACIDVAKALTLSPKLQELDLSCNDIEDVGMYHLSEGLRVPGCRLKTLKLSQCSIEQNGCLFLATSLQENPAHIKVLDLSINTIGDKGAKKLFKRFDISRLTKLEMCDCGLTLVSCGKIGEALKSESSTLVELNLSNNSLRDAGFAVICEGMYAWSSLEKLK